VPNQCMAVTHLVILVSLVIVPVEVMLTSHNTVLNFDAIIARMDCAYAEQTSIELTQQQMVTMRQGELPLMTFYNDFFFNDLLLVRLCCLMTQILPLS